MTHGVLYKLYLGFNNKTMDMFSSLCQLEEAEEVLEHSNGGKRCLKVENSDIVN
jgi:hypothetical protein